MIWDKIGCINCGIVIFNLSISLVPYYVTLTRKTSRSYFTGCYIQPINLSTALLRQFDKKNIKKLLDWLLYPTY